jgi:tRNA(Arg) A34 adenosine deaminase TadA
MNSAVSLFISPGISSSPVSGSVRRALRPMYLPLFFVAMLGIASAATEAVKSLPDDPACTPEDRKYMARAYELAAIASENGNGAYGALVVKDGKVLMEFSNNARTNGNVTHHGETGLVSLTSIRLGVNSMVGATFYTSTEPCIMCCGAIRGSRVAKLVYGTTAIQVGRLRGRPTPTNPLQVREVFERAGAGPITIVGPLMESEGLAVHAAAFSKLAAKP